MKIHRRSWREGRLVALACCLAFRAVVSVSSAAETDVLRARAACGYVHESVPGARRVLAEVRSRAPGSVEEAHALDLVLEVLFFTGLDVADDTRALADQALALKERIFGRDHPELARTLVLAARLRELAEPGSARSMLERAEAIQERSLPADDLALAETRFELYRQAALCGTEDQTRFLLEVAESPRALADLGDPRTALRRISFAAFAERESCEERLTELTAGIRELYGPSHPMVGRALHQLALCQDGKGARAVALETMEQALAILRAGLGSAHVEVGSALMNLGELTAAGGASGRAIEYERAGLAAYVAAAGEDSPLLREPLLTLASRLHLTDRFDEAFETATRAMALGPRGFDGSCPGDLASQASYAVMMRDRGDWAGAKALLEPIVERSESLADSVPLSEVLHHFGETLATLGDDSRARDYLERSLATRERVLGPENVSSWVVLTDLGTVLARLGELDAASERLERALRLLTRTYGPRHGCVSTVLRVVADVQSRRGDLKGAHATLQRALPIAQAAFGEEGGRTDLILRDLCMLEEAIADRSDGRTTCDRALRVTEARYGPQHPEVTHLLSIEAAARHAAGDRKGALELALEAERRSRAHFTSTLGVLSEREALSFEQTRYTGLDVALSALASGTPPASGADVRRVWNEVLRSRALVLDEAIARRRERADADPQVRSVLARIESARAGLVRAELRSLDAASGARSRAEIDAAIADVDAAERAFGLVHRRDGGLRKEADIEQTLAALPEGAALVAYVRYQRLDPAGPAMRALAYAALVARSRRAPVEFVPLGPAERIDRLLAEWSAAVRSQPAPGLGRSAEPAYRELAAPLRAAVWDPVRERLGSPSLVLVVPEGPLHLLAFATLPSGTDRYLVETDPPIQLLSTERDLTSFPPQPAPPGGLLAVGNPAFDALPELSPARAPYRGANPCGQLRSLEFEPLAQAGAEIEEVRRSWLARRGGPAEPALILTGAEATEQAFMSQAPSSRVIHLATHGFVLPAECTDSDRALASTADASWLTLAGLAFAGANRAAERGLGDDDADGIVTASELATLDLTRTDWVVLSACDSGLGSVLESEGVFGLRRALRIAGARTTIMSLWEVRDDDARAFMERLYGARMTGDSTVSALRSAMLAALTARRGRGLDTHPSRWGAFVAVGDWR